MICIWPSGVDVKEDEDVEMACEPSSPTSPRKRRKDEDSGEGVS